MEVGISVQGAKTLGGGQTAFDAEVAAIDTVVQWFWTPRQARFLYTVVHSDSTSAILRTHHSGVGSKQNIAHQVTNTVTGLIFSYQTIKVKGHIRVQATKGLTPSRAKQLRKPSPQ